LEAQFFRSKALSSSAFAFSWLPNLRFFCQARNSS
jgi:hypothetical protein